MSSHSRTNVLLDLRDVGRNHRGVSRSLREIGTRLLERDDRYLAVCSKAGLDLLPTDARNRLFVAPPHSQAVFEQVTLPAIARRVGAGAIYSFRECGAMWGPPLLLHVTEDPEIRWHQTPLRLKTPAHGKARDFARRSYSRLLMNRALRRAHVVTCTYATAFDLERRHKFPAQQARIVPLGIDTEHFRPSPVTDATQTPYFFHLSSDDPRERTDVVIEAFAHFLRRHDGPMRLVVAGQLGSQSEALSDHIARLGVGANIDMPGRVTDDHLVELYSGAAATVVASSNEGFGLQPLEAMACGSLLVAAAAPATEEVAAGGEIEWTEVAVLPMAHAFHAAIADPDRRERARVVNRRVAGQYSWEATASKLHQMLEELVASRTGRPTQCSLVLD